MKKQPLIAFAMSMMTVIVAALAQRSVIAKEYDHQVVSVQGKIAKTVAEIEAAKQSEQEAESANEH